MSRNTVIKRYIKTYSITKDFKYQIYEVFENNAKKIEAMPTNRNKGRNIIAENEAALIGLLQVDILKTLSGQNSR